MKFIEQVGAIVTYTPNLEELIETAGRVCYNPQPYPAKREAFIKRLIKSGHDSVLEHASVTVKITTDRAALAQLTRHRLASFSVESQRYVDYSGDDDKFQVIKPDYVDSKNFPLWWLTMESLVSEPLPKIAA
jgi:thymidylate synthase (FAD)